MALPVLLYPAFNAACVIPLFDTSYVESE